MEETNFKGHLIALCLKTGQTVKFEEVSTTGPSHDPRFVYQVFVNNEKLGEGEDKRKKTAENLASKMAFLCIKNREQANHQAAPPPVEIASPPTTPLVSNTSSTQSPSPVNGAANTIEYDPNYVGKFNEYCQKIGSLGYRFVDNRTGPSHIPQFFCSALIDDRKFPEAKGKNKKEAKKNAAQLALKVLKKENPSNPELRQIPGLDDTDVEETGNTSESGSTSSRSSFKPESGYPQLESNDSQIACRSSDSGAPATPRRSQRRTELAPNFAKCKPANEVATEDKTEVESLSPSSAFPSFHNEYTNNTRIGRGAYGEVVKAYKRMDDAYYAVKIVRVTKKKYLAEVKALASLVHKNIVRYFTAWLEQGDFSDSSESCSSYSSDLGENPETLFIQMELCENGTLEKWIKKRNLAKIVNKNKSLEIFRQIIDGVEYIHYKKYIHRDLKPSNILFTKEMIVKIGDFGLVTRMTGEDGAALQRTKAIGTSSYMAPEQRGENYGNEVDIYALGLIVFELLWIFGSTHEKADKWKEIREGKLPTQFAEKNPMEDKNIKQVLSRDYEKRPTASSLKDTFKQTETLSTRTV